MQRAMYPLHTEHAYDPILYKTYDLLPTHTEDHFNLIQLKKGMKTKGNAYPICDEQHTVRQFEKIVLLQHHPLLVGFELLGP